MVGRVVEQGIINGSYQPTVEQVDRLDNGQSSFESSEHRKMVNCCNDKKLLFKTILSGQFLSFMLCSTGTAAAALSTYYGIKTPCFYAFLMYTLLACTFGIYTLAQKDFIPMIKKMWWKYLLVSLCDVEGNYLLTKAYSYTTLTSVQLCDSITIPTVMIVSFIFLRIRYKIIHYVGVAICISGAICLLFTDSGDKDAKGNNSSEILGDAIALCAAVLYGISQVGQEYLVKHFSSKEFLGMIGIYGMILTSIQVAILERDLVHDIDLTWQIGLIFAAFAVCQYFYYAVMPVVMKLSSATVVNLSLLTSDLYTLTVGLFLFGYKFSYLYFVAFAGILVGLIIYNIRPTPTAPPKKRKDRNRNIINGSPLTTSSFVPDTDLSSTLMGGVPLINTYGATKNSFLIRGQDGRDYVVSCSNL